jgi:hypothetical protein
MMRLDTKEHNIRRLRAGEMGVVLMWLARVGPYMLKLPHVLFHAVYVAPPMMTSLMKALACDVLAVAVALVVIGPHHAFTLPPVLTPALDDGAPPVI